MQNAKNIIFKYLFIMLRLSFLFADQCASRNLHFGQWLLLYSHLTSQYIPGNVWVALMIKVAQTAQKLK